MMKRQAHLNNLYKTLSKNVFLLSQLRHYVNGQICKLFDSAHILFHRNCAFTVWDGCSEVHLKKKFFPLTSSKTDTFWLINHIKTQMEKKLLLINKLVQNKTKNLRMIWILRGGGWWWGVKEEWRLVGMKAIRKLSAAVLNVIILTAENLCLFFFFFLIGLICLINHIFCRIFLLMLLGHGRGYGGGRGRIGGGGGGGGRGRRGGNRKSGRRD